MVHSYMYRHGRVITSHGHHMGINSTSTRDQPIINSPSTPRHAAAGHQTKGQAIRHSYDKRRHCQPTTSPCPSISQPKRARRHCRDTACPVCHLGRIARESASGQTSSRQTSSQTRASQPRARRLDSSRASFRARTRARTRTSTSITTTTPTIFLANVVPHPDAVPDARSSRATRRRKPGCRCCCKR